MIYRDYLCLPNKRKELIDIDKKILKREEDYLINNYNINFETKINKKNSPIKKSIPENTIYITPIKKEKWYKKFLNKLLKFLHIL